MTTPAATYSKQQVTGGWRINIVSITKLDVSWDDIRVQLTDGTYFAEWDPEKADLDSGTVVTAAYPVEYLNTLAVRLTVTDVTGNGFVGGSDYFTVTATGGFDSATTYSAVLIYTETGEKIGNGVTFAG